MQKTLGKLHYFVVGAGAIGCEALKNLALMGVGCGEGGMITVTDMDTIEISNLSRQFLFRSCNLRKSKSMTAAAAVKTINPELHITARTDRVGTQTETIFTPEFWKSLDGVVNALDNVPSRLYVDGQCVRYKKPLLESGTLGTKGNTQIVVPHVSENYGASRDAPETEIPVCTVSNLPYMIEHTVEFMRSLFVDLFMEQPADALAFLMDPAKYAERTRSNRVTRMTTLAHLRTNLLTERPTVFDDCIMFGRRLFDNVFCQRICQLLREFPADARTEDNRLFWSGKNRMPVPATFDGSNELHLHFVGYAAYLRAQTYALSVDALDWAHIRAVAEKTPPAPVHAEEAAANTHESEDADQLFDAEMARIQAEAAALGAVRVVPAEFEKDDDSNHHIDFISAGANLRAANYGIPQADRSRIKPISGRIIPAVATPTALVAALAQAEIFALVHRCTHLEEYRNWFVNLAINTYMNSDPMPAPRIEADSPFTIWDDVCVDFRMEHAAVSLGAVLERLQKEQGWDVEAVFFNNSFVYMANHKDPKKRALYTARLAQSLVDVLTEVSKGTGVPAGSAQIRLTMLRKNPANARRSMDCPPVLVMLPTNTSA